MSSEDRPFEGPWIAPPWSLSNEPDLTAEINSKSIFFDCVGDSGGFDFGLSENRLTLDDLDEDVRKLKFENAADVISRDEKDFPRGMAASGTPFRKSSRKVFQTPSKIHTGGNQSQLIGGQSPGVFFGAKSGGMGPFALSGKVSTPVLNTITKDEEYSTPKKSKTHSKRQRTPSTTKVPTFLRPTPPVKRQKSLRKYPFTPEASATMRKDEDSGWQHNEFLVPEKQTVNEIPPQVESHFDEKSESSAIFESSSSSSSSTSTKRHHGYEQSRTSLCAETPKFQSPRKRHDLFTPPMSGNISMSPLVPLKSIKEDPNEEDMEYTIHQQNSPKLKNDKHHENHRNSTTSFALDLLKTPELPVNPKRKIEYLTFSESPIPKSNSVIFLETRCEDFVNVDARENNSDSNKKMRMMPQRRLDFDSPRKRRGAHINFGTEQYESFYQLESRATKDRISQNNGVKVMITPGLDRVHRFVRFQPKSPKAHAANLQLCAAQYVRNTFSDTPPVFSRLNEDEQTLTWFSLTLVFSRDVLTANCEQHYKRTIDENNQNGGCGSNGEILAMWVHEFYNFFDVHVALFSSMHSETPDEM